MADPRNRVKTLVLTESGFNLRHELTHLWGHDEVVFVQATNFVRLKYNPAVAPADSDVGVMPLLLAQFSNGIY